MYVDTNGYHISVFDIPGGHINFFHSRVSYVYSVKIRDSRITVTRKPGFMKQYLKLDRVSAWSGCEPVYIIVIRSTTTDLLGR